MAAILHSSIILFYCLSQNVWSPEFLWLRYYATDHYVLDPLFPIDKLLMVFSCAYFINDLYIVTMLRFNKLFIGHHLLCLCLYGVVFFYEEDRHFFLVGLFLGEISNPLQNILLLFKEQPFFETKWKHSRIYVLVYYLFALLFLFVTLIWIPFVIGPIYFFRRVLSSRTQAQTWNSWILFLFTMTLILGRMCWSRTLLLRIFSSFSKKKIPENHVQQNHQDPEEEHIR